MEPTAPDPDVFSTERSEESMSPAVGRPETEELLEQGIQHIEAGEYDQAVELLRRANEQTPEHARVESHLGLALARVGGAFEEARSLCEDASKREFDNPDLYVNLARVYLGVGRRSEALRYLRRGQMIDPDHEVIRQTLVELGRRRPAVIAFLPRRHWLNRVLGSVRGALLAVFRRSTTED